MLSNMNECNKMQVRLSHSVLWDWMRSFYEQEGVKAWADGLVIVKCTFVLFSFVTRVRMSG